MAKKKIKKTRIDGVTQSYHVGGSDQVPSTIQAAPPRMLQAFAASDPSIASAWEKFVAAERDHGRKNVTDDASGFLEESRGSVNGKDVTVITMPGRGGYEAHISWSIDEEDNSDQAWFINISTPHEEQRDAWFTVDRDEAVNWAKKRLGEAASMGQ